MDEPRTPQQRFWEGFGVAWALLFAVFLMFYAAFITWSDWGPNGPTDPWTDVPMYLLTFCGLSQLVYIIPCYIFFTLKKMRLLARGVLLGAGSILLLNLLVYFWWLHG